MMHKWLKGFICRDMAKFTAAAVANGQGFGAFIEKPVNEGKDRQAKSVGQRHKNNAE